MESVSTDVAWGRGSQSSGRVNRAPQSHLFAGYDNKILTSARNGELIMWDLNKIGPSKYGESPRT